MCIRDRSEIDQLVNKNLEIRLSGTTEEILARISNVLDRNTFKLFFTELEDMLNLFANISGAESFKLMLASVNSNMCRRFHTDINNLRLLCTYDGPGTLWLSDDNVNSIALKSYHKNENIVKDEARINKAKPGSVVILKGALYPKPGTNAVVHRSPTIEESGETRLLLRIDTNEFLKP